MAVENAAPQTQPRTYLQGKSPYEEWIESTGLPIHRGYFSRMREPSSSATGRSASATPPSSCSPGRRA